MKRTGAVVPGTEFIHADTPEKAKEIQKALRHHCILRRTIDTGRIRHVAGADAAYAGDLIIAAVVVLTFPGLESVDKACTIKKVPFPYIPGLLSFQEAPAILDAFSRITTVPDLIIVNGHGYAHPIRFGLGSHIGLLLDLPSVGVARRLLTGTAAFPGEARGSTRPIIDRDEVIGMAIRTVEGQKPVFVSAGHRADLGQAVDVALKTTISHRITEPVWHADQLSRQCRDKKAAF